MGPANKEYTDHAKTCPQCAAVDNKNRKLPDGKTRCAKGKTLVKAAQVH